MNTRSHGSRPGGAPAQPKMSFPASTPTLTPHSRGDEYYGHGEIAKLADLFIRHVFQCPDIPTLTAPTNAPTGPVPPLARFVAYALHRTRLPPSVTLSALYLLSRLKGRFPGARGSSGHRLFISAFMIASKVVCDDTYSNKSWAIVGQHMFALKEINQMEREMCGYLEWLLNVEPRDLHAFEVALRAQYGQDSVLARDYGYFGTFPPLNTSPTATESSPTEVEDPGSPYYSTGASPAPSQLGTPPMPESFPTEEGCGAEVADPRFLYVYTKNCNW